MVSCAIVGIHESQSGREERPRQIYMRGEERENWPRDPGSFPRVQTPQQDKQADISEFVSVNGGSSWTKRRVNRIYGECPKHGLAHACGDGSPRFSSKSGQPS